MSEYHELTKEEKEHADKVHAWLDSLTDKQKETLYQAHEHNHSNIFKDIAKFVGASTILSKSAGFLTWGIKLIGRKAPKIPKI